MTTEIALYQNIPDPLQFIESVGTSIAKSRMFGCETVDQGKVLAMECLAKRLPPLSLAEKYHFIQGKLSMRSDAMLAAFRQLGGKHRLLCRTPEKAEIELAIDKQKQIFSLTWEEAQAEPFVWGKPEKGQPKLKDNWATPRGRMQMMWARVVSDGVRAMAPEVVAGYYTPEEFDHDMGEADDQPVEGKKTTKPTAASQQHASDVIDAEYEVTADEAGSVAGTAGEGEDSSSGRQQDAEQPGSLSPDPSQDAPFDTATDAAATTPSPASFAPASLGTLREARRAQPIQVENIKAKFARLGLSREQCIVLIGQAALFEGAKLADLSVDQAAALQEKLDELIQLREEEAKLAAAEQAQSAAQANAATPGASEPINGPISDEQIAELRRLAEQIEAAEPGFWEKLNDKLKARGFSSLRAMKRNDGIEMLGALSAKAVKLRMDGKVSETTVKN